VDLSDPVDGGWIEAALRPRSIAIVGASADPEKIGGRPIKYMLREGYRGELFPVNAQRDEVQGLKAYRDVASLPHAPDLAVIAVPGLAAVDAVRQCAAIGTKVGVVMTSGFARDSSLADLRQEGAVGFLKKPWRRAELARVIAEALGTRD